MDEGFKIKQDLLDKDELNYVIKTYGDIIRDHVGNDIGISFFSSSEDFVDTYESIRNSLTYKGTDGRDFNTTMFNDYSLTEKKIVTDIGVATIKTDDGFYRFLKIVTPFTRERTYDFLIMNVSESEIILKALEEKRKKSNFKVNNFPIIGLDFTDIKKNTIDFLLNEEFRKYCTSKHIKLKRGIVLEGRPGCLSGDTLLYIQSENDLHGTYYTIKDAYYKFNNIEKDKIKGRGFWDKSKPKYIQSMVGNSIEYRKIKSIVSSGKKNVYELVTKNGLKIKVSENHGFKVPNQNINSRGMLDKDNFVPLNKLIVGEEIFCKNINKEKIFIKKGRVLGRRIIYSIPYHPYAWKKIVNGFDYKRLNYSRIVIEANLNNLDVKDFIQIIKYDPIKSKELKYLDSNQAIHHINEDVTDDRLENLEILSKDQHDKHHANNLYFSDTLTILDTIISINKIEEEETFDISMDGDSKNFVANNIIVHNSGKTMTIQYIKNIALANKIEFYSFKNADDFVRNQNEYEKEEKKIFVFEDFDTLLRERKDTNSSPNQILGMILNTLEGVDEINNVVSIFTTNEVRLFDSAFIRPGRIDKVYTYTLPDPKVYKEFFNAYIPEEEQFHAHIEEMLSVSNSDVSFAILKGICDDINILKFSDDTLTKPKIDVIIKEKLSAANKQEEVKKNKDYIL